VRLYGVVVSSVDGRASTSCSGSAFGSAQSGDWRSRASSRRWQKKPRVICRTANLR